MLTGTMIWLLVTLASGVLFAGLAPLLKRRAAPLLALLPLSAFAQLLAALPAVRAAYFDGVPLWKGTVRDDLRGHYRASTHSLETASIPEEDRLPDEAGFEVRRPDLDR